MFASCGNQVDSLDQEAAKALPCQHIVRQPLQLGFLLLASTKVAPNQVTYHGKSMNAISNHCVMKIPFGSCAYPINVFGTHMLKCSSSLG